MIKARMRTVRIFNSCALHVRPFVIELEFSRSSLIILYTLRIKLNAHIFVIRCEWTRFHCFLQELSVNRFIIVIRLAQTRKCMRIISLAYCNLTLINRKQKKKQQKT